jgi:hypothetical protein
MKVPDIDLDCVAYLTVRLHAHGMVSVSGHVGDPTFARQLLDHAKDAIGRHVPEGRIVVPNRDVVLKEYGDLPPTDRGDT